MSPYLWCMRVCDVHSDFPTRSEKKWKKKSEKVESGKKFEELHGAEKWLGFTVRHSRDCHEATVYIPPSKNSLQALRDWSQASHVTQSRLALPGSGQDSVYNRRENFQGVQSRVCPPGLELTPRLPELLLSSSKVLQPFLMHPVWANIDQCWRAGLIRRSSWKNLTMKMFGISWFKKLHTFIYLFFVAALNRCYS